MLQAAAVFSNHMVLQRNKKVCIFGEGVTGRKISVSFDNDSAWTRCRDGKWMVYLPEREAKEGLSLEITDGEDTIVFQDIAVGEVWLAGGQSNMELEIKDAEGGIDVLKNGFKDEFAQKVRFYYTPKQSYKGADFEEVERKSHWELFNEEDAAKWSAVGFFFAKKLAQNLGVTVGVIGCNWGGTSASCWMSRKSMLEHEQTRSYVDEYDASGSIHKSEEEQIKEYQEYLQYQEDWDKRAVPIYEKEPMISFDKIQEIIGPNKYPGPMNCANFFRPAGLYETMLKRVMPYTLRGFIYYQGESDESKAANYFALLSRMIRLWREDWNDESLSFIIVQLPMHRYQHDPDTKSWCFLRENQMKTYKTLRNTEIAVAIDCGQFHEIHPKNKVPVGERLALQALYGVYGVVSEEEAFGPIYRDYLYKDGGMEVTFDYAKGGLVCKEDAITGFEIAGEDEVFVEAKAELVGDTVFLQAEGIEEPVMARYLWTNYSEVSVFGANGLPMAPFRTHLFKAE